jgi:monofunctional biosynthetic peptidoglycan transglycosylase
MKRFLKFLLIKLPLALILLSVLSVVILKWVPVWVTPIMVSRSIEYRKDSDFHTKKKWCSLKDISPELMKAVITSEDNLFCEHGGFDRKAIEQAIKEKKEGKRLRGASTISQQTAKNVFTFCTNTALRKGLEAWWTFLIEKIWGKERILEVYLNVAEMGYGTFGAEATARRYFDKAASSLSRSEASLVAACLPNPVVYRVDKPSQYVLNRRKSISSSIGKLAYPDYVKSGELKK